jgi:creatinine amidohydrolase
LSTRDPKTTRRDFVKAAGALATAGVLTAPAAVAASPTGRHPHKYEELRPEEFYAEQKRVPLAYLPIGAMEEHGLQNVLAVDPWTALEVCLRTADRVGGIVHPIVPIAPAGHPSWSREELRSRTKDTAPPSCWVSRETCRQLYLELLEMFADLGFRACVAFSGHWPGDVLLSEMQKELGGVVGGMRFWGGGTVSLLREQQDEMTRKDPLLGGHGMMWETSLVMAINERWTDLSRVDAIKDSPLSHQLKNQSSERLQAIKTANAAFGREMLDLAAQHLGKIAQELLKA